MLKILIADDHAVVRRGLKSLLCETWADAQVTELGLARLALEKAQTEPWDLVMLDISMPDMSGLEVLRRLKKAQPQLPVLILSSYADEQYIYRSLEAGASGYLTKEAASDELIAALSQILEGQRYLSPDVSKRLNLAGL
jgi:two-component system, NarL family, invasion response regulator UvrY